MKTSQFTVSCVLPSSASDTTSSAIRSAEKDWRTSALIEVPALKSKTASRRFLQIQDNLAAWLEPYIGRTKTEKVCPKDLRNLLEIDRLNSGVWTPTQNSIKRSGKDAPVVKSLKPWPTSRMLHAWRLSLATLTKIFSTGITANWLLQTKQTSIGTSGQRGKTTLVALSA